MAVTSALAFSSSGPLVKPLLEAGWSLSAALVVRMGLAGLILSPLSCGRCAGSDRSAPALALARRVRLVPVAGCQLLFFSACSGCRSRLRCSSSTCPRPPRRIRLAAYEARAVALVILGSIIAIVGLVLVVDISGSALRPLGTLLALGAAVTVCVYFVMSERTGDDLPPSPSHRGAARRRLPHALLAATGALPFAAPL
jgi:hypothetical protein